MVEGGLDRLRPCALVAGRQCWTTRLAGSWRRDRRLGERHERWAARLTRTRPLRGRGRRELGGLPVGRMLARRRDWRPRREPGPAVLRVTAALRVTAVPAALRPSEPPRPTGAGTGWPPTPPAPPAEIAAAPAGWAAVPRPVSSSGGRPGAAPAAVVARYQPADVWARQVTRHRRIEADAEPAPGRRDVAAPVVALPPARAGRAAESSPPPPAVPGERPRDRREQPSLGGSIADLAPLPPLAVDRIADEVIRRIERRAVAQYERQGRGRMP